MKYNPFDTIAHWLTQQKMSVSEKQEMRQILLNYATTHPVKSGLLSPYTFRYIGVALASLVLVLGTSIGVTNASMKALPNQSLYGVKLWIEEFQATNQKTPEAKITFETNRIKTRFNEATTLAVRHELDDATSQVIQSGLEHSRESVRAVADSLQNTNPELALRAINSLETSFSSNGKILATIEQNTNQNIGTIVLAAQRTTERLALEKVKFEQMIALQPNSDSKDATEQKLNAITKKLELIPEITNTTTTLSATSSSASGTVITTDIQATTTTKVPSVNELVAGAKEKISQGAYSEALVSLQKAEQAIDEASLTKSLEKTYNVKTTTTVKQ